MPATWPWSGPTSTFPTLSAPAWFAHQKLLALCTDKHDACETVKFEEGNALACQVLDRHRTDEAVLLDDLVLVENLLRMTEDSKPELLRLKADQRVERVVAQTEQSEPDLHEQAKAVLRLLRDQAPEVDDPKGPEERGDAPPVDDITKSVPLDVQKLLKQGRLLIVYGEDRVARSMHLFVSKDLLYIKCKHPKENFIKQKWIVPLHQVKDIRYGYDKESPIFKASGFFKKAPRPDKCFAVFGPYTLEDQKNIHVVCDDAPTAKKWFEALTCLFNEYKKVLLANLTRK